MGKFRRHLRLRRHPPQNPHPINSMPTFRSRQTMQASRKLVGIVVFVAATVALYGDSPLQQSSAQQSFVVPQENPNRPPWAQKNKSADAAAKPTTKADDTDPAQDSGKIKV